MAWKYRLLLWITAAMAAEAYNFDQPHAISQWYPHEYASHDTRVFPHHKRVNERSAEESEPRQTSDVKPSDQIRRFYNVSSKILSSRPKPFAATRRKGGGNNQVTFPGPTSRRDVSNPEIPEDCKKYGVCEDIPDYPQERVDKVISELGEKAQYLTMDKKDDTPEIVQRVGGDFDNIPLCAADKRDIMYPKAGYDKTGSLRYIVNDPNNPIQGFRIEVCQNVNGPCDGISCFQPGYEGRCVQKYIDRKTLVLLNKDSDQTEFTTVAFPSCCACMGRAT